MRLEVPEGYRSEWVPDDAWKVVQRLDGGGRTCRRKNCRNLAVAALRRRRSNARSGFQWWHYCADHLYGREIRDGVVMVERFVPLDEVKR